MDADRVGVLVLVDRSILTLKLDSRLCGKGSVGFLPARAKRTWGLQGMNGRKNDKPPTMTDNSVTTDARTARGEVNKGPHEAGAAPRGGFGCVHQRVAESG